MPNIPTYETPPAQWKLDVPQGGPQVLAQAAHRVGISGQEAAHSLQSGFNKLSVGVGDVGKVLEQHQYNADVSTMHKDLADFTAHSLQQIGDIEASVDPNNVSGALGQVNQLLDDAHTEYASRYHGKASQAKFEELWTQRSDLIRNHIIGTAANASGEAAAKNLQGSLQTYAGTVRTSGDMTTFDSLLDAGNKSIDDHAAMIPGEKRQQFVTDQKAKYADQLATNTLEGIIVKDPAQAKAILDSGRLDQYLAGHEKSALYGHVDTAVRLREHQSNSDATEARRAENEAFNQSSTDLELSMMRPDGTLQVPKDFAERLTKLGAMPGEKSSKIENLIKFSHSINEENAKGVPDQTDEPTKAGLVTQIMGNPEQQGLEDQLFQARFDHKLSAKDFTFMHQALLRGQKQDSTQMMERDVIKQTLSTVQDLLEVTPGGNSPNAPAYTRFMTMFQAELAAAHARGKSTSEYVGDLMDKLQTDPAYLDRFKSPRQPNAGSGIIDEGGASAPLPPAIGRQGSLSRPPTDAQLPFIAATESGDRNITNPTSTSSGNAEGHYQITTGTWKDFAPKAGVSLAEYPSAISAPKEVQAKVAKMIPLKRWDPNTIRYLAQRGALG